MSSLSNRVMNMKFMQKTEGSERKEGVEEGEVKKVKDSSEWVNPNTAELIRKFKTRHGNSNVHSIGYGSINSFNNSNNNINVEQVPIIPTRRQWGSATTTTTTNNKDTSDEEDISVLKVSKLKDGKSQKLQSDFKKLNNNNNKESQSPPDSSPDLVNELWNSIGKKRKSAPTNTEQTKPKRNKIQK